MEAFEPLVWWLGGTTLIFAVLFLLSRAFGARAPRLFQVLWLLFFVKLLVPFGVWSPFPGSPTPPAAPSSVQALPVGEPGPGAAGDTGSISASSPGSAGGSFPLGWGLGAVWVVGSLATAFLSWRAYRRTVRLPVTGPVALGPFRPRIVLPPDFDRRFTGLERELILAHEGAHLRSRDPLWFFLVQAETCLFWWLPLAWWARDEFQAVSELACDRAVLALRSPDEARVYGQLLVRLAFPGLGEAGAAFAGTFGGLKRRLTAVMNPAPRGVWLVLLMGGLAFGLGATSLTPLSTGWVWPLPLGPGDHEALVSGPGEKAWEVGVVPGTPVWAAASGTVLELDEVVGKGGAVTLDHGNGYRSRYSHLVVDRALAVGGTVAQGQVLGAVFPTPSGNPASTPTTLGFTLLQNGTPLDPSPLFSQAAFLSHPDFLGRDLVWPLPRGKGVRTTAFGMEVHPFTGQWYFHTGVDWAVALGTPVRVVAAGTIVKVDYEPLGLGWYVDVDHGNGRKSRYAHLQSVDPKGEPGRFLEAGEVFAKAGVSGLATGSHLHWELLVEGKALDPLVVGYLP